LILCSYRFVVSLSLEQTTSETRFLGELMTKKEEIGVLIHI